jgi:hypothetical protein
MKKILSIIAIIFCLGNGLNAQTDGFFNYSEAGKQNRNSNSTFQPLLPISHGSEVNEPAYPTPVGSGLLILSCVGIAYASYKKKK